MQIRIVLVVALLSFSVTAAADFKVVALASEVPLNEFNVPVTQSGFISYRQCQDCEISRARMTPNTKFVVNGKQVDLKEFRKSVLSVRDRARNIVVIKHHLESETVTSLSIRI